MVDTKEELNRVLRNRERLGKYPDSGVKVLKEAQEACKDITVELDKVLCESHKIEEMLDSGKAERLYEKPTPHPKKDRSP